MRILVVSSPRSGTHWIKCLLGTIYELQVASGVKKPAATTAKVVEDWVLAGGFQDGWILHMHRNFSAKFCDVIEAVPAHLVTIVRDPYDVFVSYYSWIQQKKRPPDSGQGGRRPRERMRDKPLDDPEVLAFLADPKGFGARLSDAHGWLQSGRAITVRYEDLHQCPIEALTRVTDQIAPVERGRLESAIEVCHAEQMRQKSPSMAIHGPKWTVRVAKVGDSRERLSEAHLAIFRENYTDLIRSLGYEVR